MRSTTVMLFTNSFPYGAEEQFIEVEIIYLSKAFKKINIFPRDVKEGTRKLPENVEVCSIEGGYSWFKLLINPKIIFIFFKVILSEFFSKKTNQVYKGKFNYFSKALLADLRLMISLKKMIEREKGNVILYSYWFNSWARVLGLLNSYSPSTYKYVCRVHGYDYDVNRSQFGYIPFRKYQMKHVSQIYSVSIYGKDQIQKTYPSTNRINYHRLGVLDNGDNPWKNKETKTIVSCSSLVELKRVHLIIEILKEMECKIDWIHFGDGRLKSELVLKAEKLPTNITFEFKGVVDNSELIKFYQNNSIDLFINTSKFEGVPVSLMEAISFGIPVVGCKVGGVPEIVNEQTGILFEEDFEVKKSAELLETFLFEEVMLIEKKRVKVKAFWKNHYSADVNYKLYIEEIKKHQCTL